jgi:hypothetical protein
LAFANAEPEIEAILSEVMIYKPFVFEEVKPTDEKKNDL